MGTIHRHCPHRVPYSTHILLCILLCISLPFLPHSVPPSSHTRPSSSPFLVRAALERDPVFVSRDGYFLRDPETISHYCPGCEGEDTACCYGQMTGQYSCISDFKAASKRTHAEWTCEPHYGRVCNADPLTPQLGLYNYSTNCEVLYVGSVTCSILDGKSAEDMSSVLCQYTPSMQGDMPKCVSGFFGMYCSSLQEMQLLDPVVYGLFLIYEIFCGLLLFLRFKKQPLRARKPLNVFMGYFSGFILGAIYPTFIAKILPCPIFLNVFIVVLPMFLFSYLARSIYFFALWRINNMKLVASHILRKKKSFNEEGNRRQHSKSFSGESARRMVAKIQKRIKRYESKTEEEKALISKARDQQRRYEFFTNDFILVAMYAFYIVLGNIIWAAVVAGYSQDTVGRPLYWTVRGCFSNEVVIIIVACLALVMFSVLVVFACLMRRVRDAYNLWITTFLDVVLAGVMAAIVLLMMLLELMVFGGKSIIPFFSTNNVIMIWIVISHAIQIIYPAVHSFFWNRTSAKLSVEEGKDDLSNVKTFLKDKKLRRHFEDHCRKELSLENPYFWYEVEKYKICAVDQKVQMAHEIYQTFVQKDTLMELNVEDWRRRDAEGRLDSGEVDIFDKIQTDIEILMNDSFARFTRTTLYKKKVKEIEKQRTFYEASGLSERPVDNSINVDTRNRTDSDISEMSSGPNSPASRTASPLRRAGSLVHTLFARSDSMASSSSRQPSTTGGGGVDAESDVEGEDTVP